MANEKIILEKLKARLEDSLKLAKKTNEEAIGDPTKYWSEGLVTGYESALDVLNFLEKLYGKE